MLSKRQREIYDFVVGYVDGRGYPPTVREIGEAVGLASPSTVHAHLANLERAGYVEVRGPVGGRLRGGDFDLGPISDTAQTLAAIAPYADGPTTIRGVAHAIPYSTLLWWRKPLVVSCGRGVLRHGSALWKSGSASTGSSPTTSTISTSRSGRSG